MRNFYNNHFIEEKRKSIFHVEMMKEEMKKRIYDKNIKVHRIQCLYCSFVFINPMIYCIKNLCEISRSPLYYCQHIVNESAVIIKGFFRSFLLPLIFIFIYILFVLYINSLSLCNAVHVIFF